MRSEDSEQQGLDAIPFGLDPIFSPRKAVNPLLDCLGTYSLNVPGAIIVNDSGDL